MSYRSKERVLAALAHEQPDRVPINYLANPGIDQRLKNFYKLSSGNDEDLFSLLNVDFREVAPVYRGRKLHPDVPEKGIKVDDWGIHRRWVEHPSGGYWEYCEFPLQDADEDEVANWPMPSPDDYDYSVIAGECRAKQPYAVFLGGPGQADVINKAGMLRGTEQALIDLITEDPAGLLFNQRRTDIQLEILRRTLEAAEGGIDLLWIGDDLGTQIAPMISLELYRKLIRPIHQKFVDLASSFGIPVLFHSCGSSSWAFEDFIEMGISAVDTLQPEAAEMAPRSLKQRFGGRLAFHGCISTAGPVAMGTRVETIDYCREILEIMMPGGGYLFSPTHKLQDNSPTENVIAMYETALRYGSY